MYYYLFPYFHSPYQTNGLPVINIPSSYGGLHPSYNTYAYNGYRQYPAVDIKKLETSARKFQALMKQANLLVNKIAHSEQFAHQLMTAAQKSDQDTVDNMIKSTGVTIRTKTTFTPDGIRITLDNSENDECCKMLIALRW